MNAIKLRERLKKHFGFDTFRAGQEEIIQNVLEGKDTLVIMPTGGGKSLCFQLPALVKDGVALVISPLIALMKDQVDALRVNGVAAAYYNSSQPYEEQQEVLQKLRENELKLLYVAPESLAQLTVLKELTISLIAVDEAHCISAWGHDFRPAYQALGSLKKQFPKTPVIALTATADRATREDMAAQLGIPEAKVFKASFDRPNLFLDVRPGRNRKRQIFDFVKTHKAESGIIYCLSRKSTEKLARDLQGLGYTAKAYHAGMMAEERTAVQEDFINDEVPIVVATIAFGMGIDKSNLRWIIHYNLPKNIEGYYQEIGRAGRDGLPAHTILFHSFGDVIKLRRFAEDSANKDFQLAKLERMQQYAEALTCRRKMLLGYFGEHIVEDCGHCDNCEHPPQFFDGTIIAQKICSAITRIKEQEGVNMVVDILKGAQNAAVYAKGYQHIKTYGTARDNSWKELQDYIIQLINQGVLEVWFHENGRLVLTPLAREILFQGRKIKLAKTVDKAINNKTKRRSNRGQKASAHTDLYEELRQLRSRLANDSAVPPYIIFSDASLTDMASRLPQKEEEFAAIHGVGKAKLKKYAAEFLPVIKEYVAAHTKEIGLFQFAYDSDSPVSGTGSVQKTLIDKLLKQRQEIADEEEVTPDKICTAESLQELELSQPIPAKYIKPFSTKLRLASERYAEAFIKVINRHFDKTAGSQSSPESSYHLYKEKGMTPEEITFFRGLSKETIMGHLLKMYQEGKSLNPHDFIAEEEIAQIQEAQKTLDNPEGLRPYYDFFEEQLPYWKIKFGLALEQED